jgi:asparagine synthase (glutamine-hydrolysing)
MLEWLKTGDEAVKQMLPIGATLPLDGVRQTLGYVPTWIETMAARGKKMRPLLNREFLAAFPDRDPYQSMLDASNVRARNAPSDPVRRSMDLWSRTILPNKTLNYLGDRVEMAHSVEGRPPFLDHHVVEAARRMPLALLIRGTTEKYVLREAARPFVTDAVYRRPKHPFSAPFELKGKLYQLLQDTLRSDLLASVPFFDQAATVELLDDVSRWSTRRHAAGVLSIFTIMLSACVLQRRYALR